MPAFNDFLVFNETTLIEFNAFRFLFDFTALVDTCLQVYNLVVLFIATPKTMADYRYYLCLQAVFDLMFELWFGLILAPRITPVSNCFAFRGPINGQSPINGYGNDWRSTNPYGTNSLGVHSDETAIRGSIGMGILFFLTNTVIFVQHYIYLYRLGVVISAKNTNSRITEKFNRPIGRLAGLLAVLTISGLVGFAAYNISKNSEEVRDIMRERQIYAWAVWCFDVTANMVWFWIIVALFISAQLVNLIGGIVTIRITKSLANQLRPETYKIYMQLSIVLLLQGAVPFFCIFVPLFWMALFHLFDGFYVNILKRLPKNQTSGGILVNGVFLPTMTKIGILLIALFPLINAALNIVFIKPYRDFAKKLLQKIICCVKRKGPAGAVAPMHINTESLTGIMNIPLRD